MTTTMNGRDDGTAATNVALFDECARLIAQADGLLITAGAGLGVDSGLPDFRGDRGMWQEYPALGKAGMRFSQIANPAAFREDPELAWGFYGHRLSLYRATDPGPAFAILRRITERMEHGSFVVTSNVDGHFQKAGFDPQRVLECHGSIHHLQCARPCSDLIWPADAFLPEVDGDACRLLSPLPTCPRCGGLARPNILMFGDWGWRRAREEEQRRLFEDWVTSVERLLVIELGAGTAIPTVREIGEESAWRLIRINPREADVSRSVDVSLPLGAGDALCGIEAALSTTPPGPSSAEPDQEELELESPPEISRELSRGRRAGDREAEGVSEMSEAELHQAAFDQEGLARSALENGELEVAHTAYIGLVTYWAERSPLHHADALRNLGYTRILLERYAEAAEDLDAAAGIYHTLGQEAREGNCLLNAGSAHVGLRLFEEAEVRVRAGLDLDAYLSSQERDFGLTLLEEIRHRGLVPHAGGAGMAAFQDSPVNAWLAMGDDAAYPTDEEIATMHREFGNAHAIWTASRRVQPGDLIFFYFTAPKKAIHFVARAVTYPLFDPSIELNALTKVDRNQWWIEISPLIPIDPVPFRELSELMGGYLNLRGKPNKYLPPRVVEQLIGREAAVRGGSLGAELEAVLRVPVGDPELPDPAVVDLPDWIAMSDGPLQLESQVERHVVEPLLRWSTIGGSALRWERQVRITKAGIADYAIFDGDRPLSIAEVKLGVRVPRGHWSSSPDFRQVLRYASALQVPGMLVDCNRVFLVHPDSSAPLQTFERRSMTAADVESIRNHLIG